MTERDATNLQRRILHTYFDHVRSATVQNQGHATEGYYVAVTFMGTPDEVVHVEHERTVQNEAATQARKSRV